MKEMKCPNCETPLPKSKEPAPGKRIFVTCQQCDQMWVIEKAHE